MLDLPARRYWWVNQNKTYRQEIGGGYMWAPKRAKNGARLAFYDNMREVGPGDVIFSFHTGVIAAVGVALSGGYDCIVPAEFAKAGEQWDKNGWRVDVRYTKLTLPMTPKDHMDVIRSLLPEKYSPILDSGRGQQSYLSEISDDLARVLGGLIGHQAAELLHAAQSALVKNHARSIPEQAPVKEWEDHLQNVIRRDPHLRETEKQALVTSRIGQGLFKENVWVVETGCRVTGVDNPNHLIGSHIKPWRHSNNEERLNGENGLLLTPSIDHLFDKGYITFENSGSLLVSPRADRESLAKMGVKDESSVFLRPFTHLQRGFLDFHRDEIFLSRAR
jgi:putative restriction endonuclease